MHYHGCPVKGLMFRVALDRNILVNIDYSYIKEFLGHLEFSILVHLEARTEKDRLAYTLLSQVIILAYQGLRATMVYRG